MPFVSLFVGTEPLLKAIKSIFNSNSPQCGGAKTNPEVGIQLISAATIFRTGCGEEGNETKARKQTNKQHCGETYTSQNTRRINKVGIEDGKCCCCCSGIAAGICLPPSPESPASVRCDVMDKWEVCICCVYLPIQLVCSHFCLHWKIHLPPKVAP